MKKSNKQYTKDPLWIKAQSEMAKGLECVDGFTMLVNFDEEQADIANVVLSYFSGKRVSEFSNFIDALEKAKKQMEENYTFRYTYGSGDFGIASNHLDAAKEAVNYLFEQRNNQSNKGNQGCEAADDKKVKLNPLKRFLNI